MKKLTALLAVMAATTSTAAHGWAALICNYSSQDVVATIDVAASPTFEISAAAGTNSPNRSVAGLCMTTIKVAGTTTPNAPIYTAAPQGDCTNAIINVFDVPKTGGIASVVFRINGNVDASSDCFEH